MVLGVSNDDLASHRHFREKEKLPFPLLADVDAKVSRLYGVYGKQSVVGIPYTGIQRTTFVIGRDGRIARVWPKVSVNGHVEEVLKFVSCPAAADGSADEGGAGSHDDPTPVKSDAEWRSILTPEQYRVLRGADTELACSGKYWKEHRQGIYRCAACGYDLFDSKTKFDSGTGWPSFWSPIAASRLRDREGHEPGHGARRGALRPLRLAPRPRLRRRPAAHRPALLHELRGAELRGGEEVAIAGRGATRHGRPRAGPAGRAERAASGDAERRHESARRSREGLVAPRRPHAGTAGDFARPCASVGAWIRAPAARRPAARCCRYIVALAAFLLSMLLATAFPLLDPDEGRNAEVAREMAVDGGLLVIPHLAGMPYLDKPPALFWAAAAAIRVVGTEPWAARLPAALAAALTLALLARSAQRRGGRPFALRAAALLCAAPLFAVLSAYVIFDMPLTLCVTVVWTRPRRELAAGRARAAPAPGCSRPSAAGVLLKGPVMLAWALGGSLGAALLLALARARSRWLAWWPGWLRRPRRRGRLVRARQRAASRVPALRVPRGVARAPDQRLVPARAAVVVRARGARGRRAALVARHAVVAPAHAAARRACSRPRAASALGFVLFAAVFFSLSHSKLVTYLLPALPMLAWIAAEAWSDAERARRAAWGLTAVCVAIALALRPRRLRPVAGARRGALRLGRRWARRSSPPASPTSRCARLAAALGRPDRAFVGILLFTPVVLFAAGEPLLRYAASQSGRAAGARHRRHRARRLRALRGVLQSRHRFPARAALGAGERARPRDDEQLPGPLPRHARRPRPVDAARRGPGLRTAWTSSCVPRAAAPAPPAGYMEFFRDGRFVAYRAAGDADRAPARPRETLDRCAASPGCGPPTSPPRSATRLVERMLAGSRHRGPSGTRGVAGRRPARSASRGSRSSRRDEPAARLLQRGRRPAHAW